MRVYLSFRVASTFLMDWFGVGFGFGVGVGVRVRIVVELCALFIPSQVFTF